MTNTTIRKQLHEYIDNTSDKKIRALFTLLQDEIDTIPEISSAEMNMLHERAEDYINGKTETYTIRESHNKIRQRRKDGK